MSLASTGCELQSIDLNRCWNIQELKDGYNISGAVVIGVSKFTRPLMFPVKCEGVGVIANIPDGTLSIYSGSPNDSTETTFFQANVDGVVKGTAQGRPMVVLKKVNNVAKIRPAWLRPN